MKSRYTTLFAIASAAAAAASAVAQPLGSPVVPVLDNPNRYAISGALTAKRFFQMAATRRVDLAFIGDSNSRLPPSGSGYEDAFARAWGARYGTYATRPIGCNSGGALCAGLSSWAFPPIEAGGAPQFVLDRTFAWGGPFPGFYALLPDGAMLSPFYNSGVTLYPDCVVNIAGALRHHLTYYVFGPGSTGYFNLCARESWPGNIANNYAALPQISTAGPTPGYVDISLDIPAGPRTNTGIMFCLSNVPLQTWAAGPLVVTYERTESPFASTGVSFSNLWEQGGRYNQKLWMKR